MPSMLGIDEKVLSPPGKSQILTIMLQKCQKLALKHSIEEPVLLNYMNLPTIFCPRLSGHEETYFISNSVQTPMAIIFLIYASISKGSSTLQNIFERVPCHKQLRLIHSKKYNFSF